MRLLKLLPLLWLALPARPGAPDAREAKAATDLRLWKAVLESYFVDWNGFPVARDVREVAAQLEAGGYWDRPAVQDPWGRDYRYEAGRGSPATGRAAQPPLV